MDEQMRQKLGFEISDNTSGVRVLTYVSGGCHPASDAEIALWDALSALSQAAAVGNAELLEALKGVLRVADRETVEFDAARAAIAKATA